MRFMRPNLPSCPKEAMLTFLPVSSFMLPTTTGFSLKPPLDQAHGALANPFLNQSPWISWATPLLKKGTEMVRLWWRTKTDPLQQSYQKDLPIQLSVITSAHPHLRNLYLPTFSVPGSSPNKSHLHSLLNITRGRSLHRKRQENAHHPVWEQACLNMHPALGDSIV